MWSRDAVATAAFAVGYPRRPCPWRTRTAGFGAGQTVGSRGVMPEKPQKMETCRVGFLKDSKWARHGIVLKLVCELPTSKDVITIGLYRFVLDMRITWHTSISISIDIINGIC